MTAESALRASYDALLLDLADAVADLARGVAARGRRRAGRVPCHSTEG